MTAGPADTARPGVRRLADLSIGMTSHCDALIDERVVAAYAELCGDHNPIHEDAQYAQSTRFGRPAAHGLLVASYVQTALTELVAPGGVSVSYSISLRAPVHIGTRIRAEVTCTQLDHDRGRAAFSFTVTPLDTDALAVAGEAVVAFRKERTE